MPSAKQVLGTRAENAVADFLRRRGYNILQTHVTSRYGEIDILARHGTTWVAVEVKIRRSDRFGTAVESVTPQKIEKLLLALHDYLDKHEQPTDDVRVDVVALDPGSAPTTYTARLFQGVSAD